MTPSPEVWTFDTRAVGRSVFVYDELASTNDRAAGPDVPAGAVVVARHQTRGRGQYDRVWQSRPGTSLLMSVRLTPPTELNRPVVLTAWAAVAVGEAVRELTGRQAKIKWPNDLLVHGRKVCGILIEQKAATIIGIGLNLNQTADEFAAANLPDATSLGLLVKDDRPAPPAPSPGFAGEGRGEGVLPKATLTPSPSPAKPGEGGQAFDLRRVCQVVVAKLDAEYARLLDGERVPLEADWKWRIGLLGKHVVADLADGDAVAGRLLEMSFDGIEVDQGDGVVRVVTPEFVRHLSAV